MKLKVDDQGKPVFGPNGLPVYVHDDGKEAEFDAKQAFTKITNLNAENKTFRESKEAAEAKLKAFEGIEDAEGARKALETVKNLKEGDLVTAGKVQEIKDAAKRAAEEQVKAANDANMTKLKQLETEKEALNGQLNKHIIGGGFARSKLITDAKHPKAVILTPDIAESFFGRNFKVEDGKPVAYDAAGNKMYSNVRAGELADFDEAFERLVDSYPNKDAILRGTGSRGDGAHHQNNPGGGGGKQMKRAAFDALDPVAKNKVFADGIALVD